MNTNSGVTPDQLAAAGRALYGERCQTSLASDLHVGARSVFRPPVIPRADLTAIAWTNAASH
jgi:hypothetical protein